MTTNAENKYTPVIGLEIHAELNTRTKMFCSCLNDPEESEPNKNVCTVCMGQPGALPVMNKAAIESMLKIGTVLKGDIPATSKFDRKNYFYPDLPKGYQISQYDIPFVFGGTLSVPNSRAQREGTLKDVHITRVHLEEDTGKLMHAKDEDGSDITLVDFNRAGVPLMELVTEPDIRRPEQIGDFARELQLYLRYLGVSDADIEKGQMRVEVNLSLGTMEDGELKFGTKVEVKNIASFKMAEAAARYEIERQTKVLDAGEKVVQETRGWDDNKKATVSQRVKETSADYRYFPDPDLPLVDIVKFDFAKLEGEIPEMPEQKRIRFKKEYELSEDSIEVLVQDKKLADYFESVVSEIKTEEPDSTQKAVQLAVNYLTSDLKGLMVEAGVESPSKTKVTAENFADLVVLAANDELGSRGAKDILRKMFENGGDPREIMEKEGMGQISDTAVLTETAQKVISENPDAVEKYKGGNEKLLMFFVGKAMGELGGRANPQILQGIIKQLLS